MASNVVCCPSIAGRVAKDDDDFTENRELTTEN